MERLPELIIFLHIPKTAGSTVQLFFDRQLTPSQVFSLDSRDSDQVQKFQQLPATVKQQLRVVKGHMEFGFHEHLERPSTYVTLLRHPVDRLVSYYYFAKAEARHYLHEAASQLSLKEFVTSQVTKELDNHQVRLLTGRESLPFGKVTAADLQQAIANLRTHFAVVGVQDNVTGFLNALCDRFGLRRLRVPRENVARKRPAVAELSTEVKDAILERNWLDLELFQLVENTMASRPSRRKLRLVQGSSGFCPPLRGEPTVRYTLSRRSWRSIWSFTTAPAARLARLRHLLTANS